MMDYNRLLRCLLAPLGALLAMTGKFNRCALARQCRIMREAVN